jgi:hypothetical protein
MDRLNALLIINLDKQQAALSRLARYVKFEKPILYEE